MGLFIGIFLGLNGFLAVNALNLYQDQNELPASVDATSACGKALNASVSTSSAPDELKLNFLYI